MPHQQETPKHASGKHRGRGKTGHANEVGSSSKPTASLAGISEEGDSNYLSHGKGSRPSSKSRGNIKRSASKGKRPSENAKVIDKKDLESHHQHERARDAEVIDQRAPTSHHQHERVRDAVLATLADRTKTRMPGSQTRLGASTSTPKFADRKNGSNVPVPADEWIWNESVLGHLIQEAQAEWVKFNTLESRFKAQYMQGSAEEHAMNVDRETRERYESYVNCAGCGKPDKGDRRNLMKLLYAKQYGKEELGGQLLQTMEDLLEIDDWMKRFEKDKQRMKKNDDAIPKHDVAAYKRLLRLAGEKGKHGHEKGNRQAKRNKGERLGEYYPSDIEMDILRKNGRLV
jgi:hypothetical protein